MVDVVMLSVMRDIPSYRMTRTAVDTLRQSDPNWNFRIRLVETNPDYLRYGFRFDSEIEVVCPGGDFRYNAFLNAGLESCTGDYVVIANNDLIFEENWFTRLQKGIESEELDSASPYCPGWAFHKGLESDVSIGWRIGYEFCGWCMCWTRETREALCPLDERFVFWCQDNDIARTLEGMGKRHGLVGSSRVRHLVNQSHRFIPPERYDEMVHGAGRTLESKWASNDKEGAS